MNRLNKVLIYKMFLNLMIKHRVQFDLDTIRYFFAFVSYLF